LRFRAPSETHSRQLRTTPSYPPAAAGGRLGGRCFLSWALVPYDTCQADGCASLAAASGHRRGPRAGFGYPLRDLHHRPYRRTWRRSVHGLLPSRLSPPRGGCPSRGPCPLDVSAAVSPGGASSTGRLQGLVLASSPCCHRRPEGLRPSMPSWGFPLQSVLPIRPGDSLVVALPSLSPFRRSTSRPTWVSGHLGVGWIGLARFRATGSLGVLHLLTVAALRPSIPGAGSWFHLTPDATHDTRPPHDLSPLERDAVVIPRSTTRCHRLSVHG
jgi:hypothetical protein